MAIPALEEQRFLKFTTTNAPLATGRQALVDFWVKLPKAERFIVYVRQGDEFTEAHARRLSGHLDSNIYVLAEDLVSLRPKLDLQNPSTDIQRFKALKQPQELFTRISADETQAAASTKFLQKSLPLELRRIYRELMQPQSFSELSMESSYITELAVKLTEAVAPDANDIRKRFSQVEQFVGVMDDSAAITAIVMFFALATEQSSPAAFRDYAYACLLMDLSLFEVSHKDRELYALDPRSVSLALRVAIENHPIRSLELVERKFQKTPASVKQLILGHHELFSGRGYPSKTRSELLAPVVKTLALAVDTFDHMKRAKLNGKKLSVAQALDQVGFADVPAHQRRHNIALCRSVRNFLNSPLQEI